MNDLPLNLIVSLFAAVATMMGAVLTMYRARRETRAGREQVEKIADAVQAEHSARKAAVLERVVERVPVGLSQEQFSKLIDEIGARLPSQAEPEGPVLSAVESLVNHYHQQALSQARVQFWFSIVAATGGFIWIIVAGSGIEPANLATTSKILPGTVVDAVAFLFFRQAEATRQRATELYDRLRRDKQMIEAATLVASIEDVRLRSAVKAQLALHMSGLEPAAIDLGSFLSRDGDSIREVAAGGPNKEMNPTAGASGKS